MQDKDWRVGHPEDSREILSKYFSVTIPGDAYTKAMLVLTAAAEANYAPENIQLSISSDNVLVTLHSFTEGVVCEKDYALAKQIDVALL